MKLTLNEAALLAKNRFQDAEGAKRDYYIAKEALDFLRIARDETAAAYCEARKELGKLSDARIAEEEANCLPPPRD